ncbi:hypothetical protein [Hymenobacter cheonanensis]|uniref:hypothetical protein n=1 Tax=Hymenobacter sp. CA2-7 TaxID=3063993 RepID=UPI0027129E1F|nr:hypothetical protein [Hymenobacter sp. CA2-7]MDO7886901.1 hypothetical protein [Hymenobacter sp. CA2-7]
MSKPGSRALLAAAWALELGLAGCGSPSTKNGEKAPARYTSHVAAVVTRTQALAPPPPGAAPAAGSAQINTVTELLPAARFEVP